MSQMFPSSDKAEIKDFIGSKLSALLHTDYCLADRQFLANPQIQHLDISGEEAKIIWATEDAHESIFPLTFLQRAAYDPPLISAIPPE